MVFNGITPFKRRIWFWIYSAILCNESVTVHFFEAGGSIGGLGSILSEFHSLGINSDWSFVFKFKKLLEVAWNCHLDGSGSDSQIHSWM